MAHRYHPTELKKNGNKRHCLHAMRLSHPTLIGVRCPPPRHSQHVLHLCQMLDEFSDCSLLSLSEEHQQPIAPVAERHVTDFSHRTGRERIVGCRIVLTDPLRFGVCKDCVGVVDSCLLPPTSCRVLQMHKRLNRVMCGRIQEFVHPSSRVLSIESRLFQINSVS